jgi:hypothetical protein
MSHEREPRRWADPASDCDPALRSLVESARDGLGDPALAQRIEQGVRARIAADSGHIDTAITASKRAWLPWVGIAGVLMALAGGLSWSRSAALGTRADDAPLPANPASSAAPAAMGGKPSAERAASTALGGAGAASELQDETRLRPSFGEPTERQTRATSRRARAVTPSGAKDRATAQRGRTRSTSAEPTAPRDVSQLSAVTDQDASGVRPRAVVDAPTQAELRRSSGVSSSAHLAPDQHAVPPELALIADAQRALRTAPAKALALAEQHARAYPAGRFTEEREEIAISALWALGDRLAARTRGEAFLAQHPHALCAPRITRLLAGSR